MSYESPELVGSEGRVVETNKEARNWATVCHLGGLAFYVLPALGHIVVPLVVWLLKKNDFAFVDDQGKEALNFQISVTLYLIVAAISVLACIGFVLVPVVLVAQVVLAILAAVRTSNGEYYRYPLTIRFVK